MEIIYNAANLATGFVEAYISYILFETFLKRRENIPRDLFCCTVLLLGICIDISNHICGITMLNFFVTVIVSLSVSFVYCGTLKTHMMAIMLSCMISIMTEIITLLLLSVLFDINVRSLVSNGMFRIAGIIISKSSSLICAKFISYRVKREFELLNTNYWGFFTVMFASANLIIGLFYMILAYNTDNNFTDNYIRNILTICTFLMLIITVIILYLYENTLKQQIQISRQKLSQMQLNNQIRHYNAMIMSQNQIKGLRHDLKNHMLSIYAKLNKKEYADCLQYVSKMLDSVNAGGAFEFDTGNTVLDAILSAKKEEAEKKHISFNANLCIPRSIPIHENDICIIFGNALDNAIEACEKVEDKPYIEVLISYENNSLICRIENSCAGSPDGITSKKDVKNHGIGRSNIEKSLNNYESVFNIEHNEHRYILSFIVMDLNYTQ